MSPRPQRLLPDALLASTGLQPDRIGILADGASYSYASLLDASLRLARALQESGVRRGDRVAVFLENSWPAVVAIYGTLLAGAVLTVINPQTKADKLAFMLDDSDATALVTERSLAPVFRAALACTRAVRCVISSGGPPDDEGGGAAIPGRVVLSFDDAISGSEPCP